MNFADPVFTLTLRHKHENLVFVLQWQGAILWSMLRLHERLVHSRHVAETRACNR